MNQEPRPPRKDEDEPSEDDQIDEASDESFPASDAPSFTAAAGATAEPVWPEEDEDADDESE